MTGRRRAEENGDEAGDRSFADRMADLDGIRPVGPEPRVPPSSAPEPARPAPARADRALRIPDADEPLLAHRSFVRRRVLRDLRAGRIPPDDEIDLHRLDRRAAERRLREGLARAKDEGHRCVLVIFGRGRHSAQGRPVLASALPGWLGDPALAGSVAAFAPAIPRDGGRGAVYVLLP